MTDREIRKLSRKLNKGHYAVSFSILLYAFLSFAASCALPYFLIKGLSFFKTSFDVIGKYAYPAACVLILFILTSICFMTFSSVSIGEKAWYSGRLIKQRPCGKRLRFWFMPKHSLKALRLNFLLFCLNVVWTVLLLSPALLAFSGAVSLAYTGGVEVYLFISLMAGGAALLIAGLIFRFVIIQRYFLAPYLLASDPKLKPLCAVKQSKNLLDGHIMRIVKFKLKYIPAFLLYPLIIPIIFFHSDYKQGCTLIAKEICL